MTSNASRSTLSLLGTMATALALQSCFQRGSFAVLFVHLLCLEVITYCVYMVVIYPFFLSPLRGGKFLLGHGMAAYEQPAGNTFLKWMRNVPNDGLIFYRGLFYQDRLLVTSPQALSEVLVTRTYDFQKPKILRDFLRLFLGDGLIIVEEDLHQFQRKNIAPAFTFRVIKEMYPVFWAKAKQFVRVVGEQVAHSPQETLHNAKAEDASVVEIGRWASQVSLDTIGIAIGQDFQTLANSQDPLIANYKELTNPTFENQIYFLCNMVLSPTFVSALPWRVNQRNKRLLRNIASKCLGLIETKKEELESGTRASRYSDVLSLLIESRNFSTSQLVDQILTLMVAGHETTWSTFTWITFLLARHPGIQQNLRNEVTENLPCPKSADPSEVDFDFDVAEKLPILNGVCNETLRLYPAIPVTARDVVRPTQLAGQHVPAGTQIIVSPWAINRDETLWGADAHEFKPERWIDIDEAGKQRVNNTGGTHSNYAFLTFLHGPRSCIGQGFAKAELRLLVAAFVACFEMQMADPHEVVIPYGVVAVKPKTGLHLRLKRLPV
ncbi:hypothetical protein M409DRAFT_69247 [Zasmidium cellare ATCC 36951]|uniref:Cytochrome P450 n=1 Tax=Zasmidium cellare ATCC 36951 TaxID=1080233 RepID=A0A6A6C5B3_ZASCE|nr:uncharacterized protein M409DRAFT_69247 [Zasmidium cellare ATCC 36951]KAF2162367.1 hypothetical protein M409DRAFT_69247 [Zasmidium cellare ATCC 36951]